MWHCMFGHLNHKVLRMLYINKMVIGLPLLKTSEKICTICLSTKKHKDLIPKKSLWRVSKLLQLIHSDIYGPSTPISSSNKRYILSFINDFTRKNWVYLLHEKSEAFATFRKFKACVEKEIKAYITCLRTNKVVS